MRPRSERVLSLRRANAGSDGLDAAARLDHVHRAPDGLQRRQQLVAEHAQEARLVARHRLGARPLGLGHRGQLLGPPAARRARAARPAPTARPAPPPAPASRRSARTRSAPGGAPLPRLPERSPLCSKPKVNEATQADSSNSRRAARAWPASTHGAPRRAAATRGGAARRPSAWRCWRAWWTRAGSGGAASTTRRGEGSTAIIRSGWIWRPPRHPDVSLAPSPAPGWRETPHLARRALPIAPSRPARMPRQTTR